jgi:S-adenosyl-L-methionine hydrolase (adenosine-forming)
MSSPSPTFRPSGLITLTTDFGQEGPFVAVMKGRVLSRFPEARLIDITHEVPVHWPVEAGFWLARAYQYFPVGTVHVAVVDPGVGTRRDIIGIATDGHVFLAPDNGLLAQLANRAQERRMYRLATEALTRLNLGVASATFHGRDIFAPLAAEIAAGRLRVEDIGPEVEDMVPSWVDEPVASKGQIVGSVITQDHFGNLITNIEADMLNGFVHPVVRTGGHEFALRRTYGDVRPGEFLALINSFGVLEIAQAERSAADALGLGRGAPVSVNDR